MLYPTTIESLSSPRTVDRSNAELIDSLGYAAVLQQGILPKKRHFDRIFTDSFVLYRPCHFVSGDFYWLAELDDLIYIAVGDCMGHGVPGAMLSVLAHSLLDYAVLNKRIKKTHKILKEFDKRFLESFSSAENAKDFDNDWIDISLCCIDRSKRMLYFSGAKRSILVVTPNGSTHYKGCSYPIGGWQIEPCRPFESEAIPYTEGDMLYMYTDGFQDQPGGPNDRKYKFSNMKRLFEYVSTLDMSAQKEIFEMEYLSWKGLNPAVDDVCVVGVKL